MLAKNKKSKLATVPGRPGRPGLLKSHILKRKIKDCLVGKEKKIAIF